MGGGSLDHRLAVLQVANLRLDGSARELGGRPLPDDHAVAQHRHAIGQLLRLVEVVRRQEDRLAERAQVANRLPGAPPCAGVEARRRLVEEDQLGVADERQAEVEAAFLPAGQRSHACVALVRQPDDLDHLARVARSPVVAGEHRQALSHRQRRI